MTRITINPFFNTTINGSSFRKIILSNGFTIKRTVDDEDLILGNIVELNETLTTTQKNNIKAIFTGTAFIEFD